MVSETLNQQYFLTASYGQGELGSILQGDLTVISSCESNWTCVFLIGCAAISAMEEDDNGQQQRRRLDSLIPSASHSDDMSGSEKNADLWVEVGGCKMRLPSCCRRLRFPSTLDPQGQCLDLFFYYMFIKTCCDFIITLSLQNMLYNKIFFLRITYLQVSGGFIKFNAKVKMKEKKKLQMW